MSAGSKQTTNSNQTQTQSGSSQTVLPDYITNQGKSNLDFSNDVASNYQTPMQQTPAGFTPDTLAAFKNIMDLAQQGGNNPANQSAMNLAQQAGDWQAPQVYNQGYTAQNVADPTGYQAAQAAGPERVSNQQVNAQNVTMDQIQASLAQANLLGPAATYQAQNAAQAQIDPNSISRIQGPTTGDLSAQTQQLMNPYTQNVYDTSLTDLDRARQMTQMGNAAQAAQAGAFGSSRQGVMDSLTNADFARQASSLAANLNSQGYTQAQNTAQALQQQQQAAAGSNQQIDLQTALTNAGFGQQVALSNQGAQNQAGQYNTGSQNQFSMANQSAQNTVNLANQSAQNQIALANQQNNQWAQGSNQSANLQASLANAQNALQAGMANQSANLQNNQFNASALNNAGQFNAGQSFQAGLANQAAQNQGGQFNAQQWLQASLANQSASQATAQNKLAAAGVYGNLGNNQFNQSMQANNAALGVGNQQQQYNQNVQDTQYQNAQAANNNPLQQLLIRMQALQATPYGTTTNTSGTSTGTGTSTTKQTPGLMDFLSMGLQGASLIPGLSDMRLKENIMPAGSDAPAMLHPHLRDPLKAVRRIRPVTYNWRGAMPHQRQLGLLAQNVEQAVPEAVKTMPGPAGLKAIDHPAMLGLLTGAIQQLDRKVSGGKRNMARAI